MDIWTLDFETFYGPKFSLTSLSYTDYMDSERFKVHGLAAKRNDEPACWLSAESVREFLEGGFAPGSILVMHNAAFDATIITRVYGIDLSPYKIICTKNLAALQHGFYQGLSLMELTGEKGNELKLSYGKRELDPKSIESLAAYSCNDVDITYKLLKRLLSELQASRIDIKKELGAIDATHQLLCPTTPLYVKHDILHDAIRAEQADTEQKLQAVARQLGMSVLETTKIIRSRVRFVELLERLRVVIPQKTSKSTGKQTAALAKSDDGLQRLAAQYAGLLVGEIIALKQTLGSTLAQTRSVRILRLSERPMQVHLTYAGAQDTFRWSGANKVNLQNLPRGGKVREALRAPQGSALIVCDYSAIEARVLAWLCGNEPLLAVFRAQGDVYVDFAMKLWPDMYSLDDETFKSKRYLAKTIILSSGYQAGWSVLESTLRMGEKGPKTILTRADAEHLGMTQSIIREKLLIAKDYSTPQRWSEVAAPLKAQPALFWHYGAAMALTTSFRQANPQVVRYWSRFNSCAAGLAGPVELAWRGDDLDVHLPGGTTLIYPDMCETGEERTYLSRGKKHHIYGGKMVGHVTQSTARNLLRDAWIEARKAGLHVVLTVHDELVLIEKEQDAEAARQCLQEIMCKTPDWAPGLPVSAEAKIIDNYGEK